MKKPNDGSVVKDKAMVNVTLDAETHKKFKIKTIQDNTTMVAFLQKCVREYVK